MNSSSPAYLSVHQPPPSARPRFRTPFPKASGALVPQLFFQQRYASQGKRNANHPGSQRSPLVTNNRPQSSERQFLQTASFKNVESDVKPTQKIINLQVNKQQGRPESKRLFRKSSSQPALLKQVILRPDEASILKRKIQGELTLLAPREMSAAIRRWRSGNHPREVGVGIEASKLPVSKDEQIARLQKTVNTLLKEQKQLRIKVNQQEKLIEKLRPLQPQHTLFNSSLRNHMLTFNNQALTNFAYRHTAQSSAKQPVLRVDIKSRQLLPVKPEPIAFKARQNEASRVDNCTDPLDSEEDERYNFSFSHNKKNSATPTSNDKPNYEMRQPLFETHRKYPVTAFTSDRALEGDSILTDNTATVLSAKGPMMNVRRFPSDFFSPSKV